MITNSAEYKLMKARTNLVINEPFFGVLSMRFKWVCDPSCETAWTNGSALGYNPTFIDQCDVHDVEGLLVEAVSHVALGHPWRRDARDQQTWDLSTDHAVHPMLVEKKFRIKDARVNPAYAGKSAEWIYSQEIQKEQKGGQYGSGPTTGSGSGSQQGKQPSQPNQQPQTQKPQGKQPSNAPPQPQNGPVSVRDCRGEGKEKQKKEWEQATIQAAKNSQGNVPAGIQLRVDELTKARVDWKSVLRRFFQAAINQDYTWQRPNRRYMGSGLYLPSMKPIDGMPEIVIGGDSSGSVVDAAGEFGAEMKSIIEEVLPERTFVGWIDAALHSVEVFERGDQFEMNPKGGGGTDFCPLFDWLSGDLVDAKFPEPPQNPACVIYLTDLYGTFPEVAPDCPVLWVSVTPDKKAPFGETVYMDRSVDEERG